MTYEEAKESLLLWKEWAEQVLARWPEDSPLANLARRRVLQAELRLLEAEAYLSFIK